MQVPAYIEGDLRVQFLSDRLVRIERRGPKGFEDRPTFTAVGRGWPGTPFRHVGDRLVTKGYTVVLIGRDFKGVRLVVGGKTVYTIGDLPKPQWLPAPGKTGPVWAMADSPRLIPPPGGAIPANIKGPFAATSGYDAGNDAPDLYLFVTQSPQALRRDFLKLTGPVPLVPRYTLGYWDSRYFPYTQPMALASIDEYRRRGLPLDLFVVDTNWRIGASKGYGVDTRLFPDMAAFLHQAHGKGVRTMFNDHPEPQAPTALDPKETRYRWDGLTGLFRQGLDVWWFDRNWSTRLHEPMPGLDPETWGASVFHDVTAAYRPEIRPLVMSNVDGIDNGIRARPPYPAFHRYPIWWTGDTTAAWSYLRRAVENGVDEGVLGMLPYVHEDAGGHVGVPSPELYTRFLQYAALSPVLRVHCTYGRNRYPWSFGPQAEQAVTDSIRFRYRLLPTLYSAVHRAAQDGTPLLRRLDLEWPKLPEAASNRQYLLGDDLLVSPVTASDVPDLKPYPGVFHGEYFANKELSGTPALVRDESVDFNWDRGAPAPGLPNDDFSVRWTGRIGPIPRTMEYRFGTSSDDGVRLWIDGKKIVDAWTPLDSITNFGTVRLEEGKTYDLKMEYFESTGGANAHLLWGGDEAPRQGPMPWSFWVPPGAWLDPWTGNRVVGPMTLKTPADLRRVPMLVRDGAVFFLGDDHVRNADEQLRRPITVEAFPGPKTVRTLVEDDGVSVHPQTTVRTVTSLRTATGVQVTLSAAKGQAKPRDFVFRIHLRPGETVRSIGKVPFTLEKPSGTAHGLDSIFRARGGAVVVVRFPALSGEKGASVELSTKQDR
ncbi:hypothetical protein BH11ARM2_BH11ARM2_00380 [soil metagenome]